MSNQMRAISANPRLRRNQTAELEAKRALLPQIIANKRRKEDLARQEELKNIQISQFERQHFLAKKRMAAEERAGEVGMGMEAAKLGTTLATRFGHKTFGDLGRSTKSLFGFGGSTPSSGTSGGFLNNLSVGSALGGGLAGFGVSKMIGKKNKLLGSLAGAGVGAALGLLGGSNSMGGMISGGLGGALGGLF